MSTSHPLQESDLIFPSAASSIPTALKSLKRSNLTITNRLRSIAQDAEYVTKVAGTLTASKESATFPLIANERCGSWYIPPSRKVGSAYFKSTDGHFGIWDFSLRRLNLQVIEVVGKYGGCIIVDSTRRGKSMPDALSKTVPIWTAVLNRVLFPEHETAGKLWTPEDVVSPSEHTQIEERINGHVESLKRLNLDLDGLRSQLRKPMRPVWVTPDSELDGNKLSDIEEDMWPVVLCTASSRSSGNLHDDPNYVQGAADDSEAWACGLNAYTFWQYGEELLAASEDDLPGLIQELLAKQDGNGVVRRRTLIKPTSTIWISDDASLATDCDEMDVVIHCAPEVDGTLRQRLKKCGAQYIHLACGTGKVGSRRLRAELPKLGDFLVQGSVSRNILVTDATGKDVAVGAALAIICMHCKDDGTMQTGSSVADSRAINKTLIKQRLSWIMVSMPDASPSRATLQSVNAFLMD